MLAGTEYPPANWMNDRLRQLGEKWAFGEQPYLPKPALTKGFLQAGKREFRYTQFIPESRLEINMGMINKGTEPTYHSYGYMAVELVENAGRTVPEIEATDKKQLHKFHVQAIANYSKRIRNGDKGEMLGVGDEKWNTFGIQNLTQPQVDGLLSGDNRFFIYYWAKWNGAIDDLQECYWLQKPDAKQIDPPKLVWHICHQ